MAFEFYISRTAVELIALGLVIGVGAYIARDIMNDEKGTPEVITEG